MPALLAMSSNAKTEGDPRGARELGTHPLPGVTCVVGAARVGCWLTVWDPALGKGCLAVGSQETPTHCTRCRDLFSLLMQQKALR